MLIVEKLDKHGNVISGPTEINKVGDIFLPKFSTGSRTDKVHLLPTHGRVQVEVPRRTFTLEAEPPEIEWTTERDVIHLEMKDGQEITGRRVMSPDLFRKWPEQFPAGFRIRRPGRTLPQIELPLETQ